MLGRSLADVLGHRLCRRQLFFEALQRYLAAGVDAGAALRAMSHSESGAMRRYAEKVQARWEEGKGLADAVASEADADPADAAVLAAAEGIGRLGDALGALAGRIHEQRRSRARVLRILAYPFGVWLSSAFLLALPMYVFRGPFAYGWAVAREIAFGGGVAVGGLAVAVAYRLMVRSGRVHGLWSRVPVFGRLSLLRQRVSFARVWSAATAAGLGVHRGLALASSAAASPAWRSFAERVGARLDAGGTLVAALKGERLLGQQALVWLESGEGTGTLDVALARVAEEAEEQRRRTAMLVTRIGSGALSVALLGWVALRTLGALQMAATGALGESASHMLEDVAPFVQELHEAQHAIEKETPYRPLPP